MSNVTTTDDMFTECNHLKGEAGTVYDGNNIDATYARVDGGTSNPGYFTLAVPLTAKTDGTDFWVTYYNASDNMIAPDATVYTAVLNAGNTSVTLTEVEDKVIRAGQAVILKGTKENLVIGKTAEAGTDSYADNCLKGGSSVPTGVAYTLAKPTGKELGFYQFTGTLDPNKAHLEIASAGARQFIGFGEAAGTTAIESVEKATEAGGTLYDLTGRPVVGKPKSGIYVRDGKKLIVK